MRRFEFVQGSSAKFWEASVDGNTFVTTYGRLGAAGQRKEKEFASAAVAQKELDKKVAEKLREGYVEVVAGAAPAGAKGAAAASQRLQLPSRIKPVLPSPADVKGAATALSKVSEALTASRRSWVIGVALRHARTALGRVAGAAPAEHPDLAVALDTLLAQVGRGKGKLSIARAIELLWYLDTTAFERAREIWSTQGVGGASIDVLSLLVNDLGDSELAFRLGALITGRVDVVSSDLAWARRWAALSPLLEAQLASRKGGMRAYLKQIAPPSDARFSRKLRLLQGVETESTR